MALSYEFHVCALDELLRRYDPLVRGAEMHESIRAFGRLLHLAHLPTLASIYLDWLSRPLGHRAAALDYVTGFGNEIAFWAIWSPWRRRRRRCADAVRLLARESATLPHEPSAGQALALLIAGARDARAPLAELDARIEAQTRRS